MYLINVLVGYLKSRQVILGSERGASTVEWMMLSVVALAVMALLIVAMPDLAQAVLDYIQDTLGV